LDADTVKRAGGIATVFKTICMFVDWVNTDENIQVNGIQVFADLSNVTLSSVTTLWTAENGKRVMHFYQVI
jgi:hypothetical protein